MVHLTVLAAKIFLEVMLESAKDYFNVALTNPEQDNGEYNGTETETDTDVEELVQKVQELEKKFKLQNEKYTSYDLMFARIREEVDSTLNKLKENRVFINKLKSVTLILSQIYKSILRNTCCNDIVHSASCAVV
jgi:hypothetical protein